MFVVMCNRHIINLQNVNKLHNIQACAFVLLNWQHIFNVMKKENTASNFNYKITMFNFNNQ